MTDIEYMRNDVEDYVDEEIKSSRGPTKKDIKEIEKEFSDVLDEASVDDVSDDDPRFTVSELKKIDIMWKILTDKKYSQKKRMERMLNKDIEKITADEYLTMFDDKEVEEESEDVMDSLEEVSFESLENYDEASEYYEE